MTDWPSLLRHINEQDNDHKEPDYVTAMLGFPLPRMYSGQQRAVTELSQHKSALLCSPTGAGKTPTFLTACYNTATLVIEPRKFLQKQVGSYRDDTILFGRKEYACHYAAHAGEAPCLRKTPCGRTEYAKECPSVHDGCRSGRDQCKVFLYDRALHRYPCTQCAYNHAVSVAKGVISHGGTIICNFGNFWQFVQDADLIIIDEADLFFKEISAPTVIWSCKDPDMDISKMLAQEAQSIEKQMQTCTTSQYYALRNAAYKISFLQGVAGLCFSYKKKDHKTKREKVYVEVNPSNTNLLKDHIFGGKRVIIVTATPSEFNLPAISYSIHQRCKIYYTPQGKLTSKEIQKQPWILNQAAGFITETSAIFEGLYGSRKFVVHCGNIGTHATNMNLMLNEIENRNRKQTGVNYCTLHQAGNLMETIDTFMANSDRYLLVASAEYGADFSWCNCQFVLKFPYASLDDRLRALERKIGKEKFNQFYTTDAINRVVQQCGRVGRGWDSFGCTFILDSKFGEVWKHYRSVFPEWFRARMCPEVF